MVSNRVLSLKKSVLAVELNAESCPESHKLRTWKSEYGRTVRKRKNTAYSSQVSVLLPASRYWKGGEENHVLGVHSCRAENWGVTISSDCLQPDLGTICRLLHNRDWRERFFQITPAVLLKPFEVFQDFSTYHHTTLSFSVNVHLCIDSFFLQPSW